MTAIVGATLYLTGYDWGPGVSKVIFAFSDPIEKVDKEGASIRTAERDREIKAFYLSNQRGDRVDSRSRYATMELDTVFDPTGSCAPFFFNLAKFHNEWTPTYIVKATFHVTVDGRDTLIGFKQDCINNRICPDSEQFTKRGTFSGKYVNPLTNQEEMLTLQYAAYEPRQLKKDNAKNPLIIWIHGQGEGGVDVDIDLLGNPVTYLAKQKIQSYFTTKNGAKGIYVLAIQTPTMWMDCGDGQNHNGDKESRFLNILIDSINYYLKQNTDVDRNRIYIGGCSNGGYMSMNLLIHFPEMFAASYQACEAYAYMVFKKDEDGKYVHMEDNPAPTAVYQTDERHFTDEKMNKIKDLPIWLIASHDDDTVLPYIFEMPTYKQLLKLGAKNVWFSYFETVEGILLPGVKFNGHWSWVRFFNDQVTKVQDREKIMNSADDDKSFGFVPSNDGGGSQEASDEKGTYKSIFAWLNAQVKH